MHHGDWNDHWDGGAWWWWIPMGIMMIAFWGGLVWLGVTLLRRTDHHPATPHGPETGAATAGPTPQEILAERLARGEIEPDEYRRRLDALRDHPT